MDAILLIFLLGWLLSHCPMNMYFRKYQFDKYRMGYIWEKLLAKHLKWGKVTNVLPGSL